MPTSRHAAWACALLCLLVAGCPRAPRLPEQIGISSVLAYEYLGTRVIHQYSDRDYLHIRLQFGWMEGNEYSYADQNLAVEAAFTCGAGEYSPAEWARRIELVGAKLAFLPTPSGPVVTFDCLPERLKDTWRLINLALTNPKFDKGQFARLRAGRVAGEASLAADPWAGALHVATAAAWPAAGALPWGAPASVEELSASAAAVAFNDLMRVRCNLHIATVGPINSEQVADLIVETVGELPEGTCTPAAALAAPTLGQTRPKASENGPEAIAGIFPGPAPATPTAVHMRLVMHMLGERLHARLVERDHVATTVEARYVAAGPGFALIQAMGSDAMRCGEFVMSELRRLRTEGFTEAELLAGRKALGSQVWLGYEAAPDLATGLASAEQAGMPTMPGHEPELLQDCDLRECNGLLERYLTGITWGIVGDTTAIDRKSLHRL